MDLGLDNSPARDLLFVVDGSRSMNARVRSSAMTKMAIVKAGLMGYIAEQWPMSYSPWPLRVGVSFYRLLGTPGSTNIDVVIPLDPAPASLELFRLYEMRCRGGSPLADAVRYAVDAISRSVRTDRRIKLVSDGGNDGEPVDSIHDRLKSCGVPIDVIELSESATEELRGIARTTGGEHSCPKNVAEFNAALRN